MPADRKTAPCPLCGTPVDPAYRPFCSRGCRDRDLIGWMDGNYRLAERSTDDDELSASSDYGVDRDVGG